MSVERSIDAEATVNAPVPAVWRLWTTSDGAKEFFAAEANIELRIDGAYEIFFDLSKPRGDQGSEGMRIIGFQKNKMLTFTWNAPPHLREARRQRTVVIVRFHELATSQTRVRLRHIGWGEGGEWDAAFEYFRRAWPMVFANLERRFTDGPIDWRD